VGINVYRHSGRYPILPATIGPLKAQIAYASVTQGTDAALRRHIAFHTGVIATIVTLFVRCGHQSSRPFDSADRWPLADCACSATLNPWPTDLDVIKALVPH
jgi:hypothetical protein